MGNTSNSTKKKKKKWGQSLFAFQEGSNPRQMSPLRKADADVTSSSAEMTQPSARGQPPYSFQASTWNREGRDRQTLGWGSLPTAGAGRGRGFREASHTALCRMGCTNWGLTYEKPSKSDWSMLAMTSWSGGVKTGCPRVKNLSKFSAPLPHCGEKRKES